MSRSSQGNPLWNQLRIRFLRSRFPRRMSSSTSRVWQCRQQQPSFVLYFLAMGSPMVIGLAGCPPSRGCSGIALITCDVRLADSTESVLKGFNNTILAYGQTGTGKTYTILGGTYVDTNKKQKKIDELRARPRPCNHLIHEFMNG